MTYNSGENGCRLGGKLGLSMSNGHANNNAKEGHQERRPKNPDERQSSEGDPPNNLDRRHRGAEGTKGQQAVIWATEINAHEATATP